VRVDVSTVGCVQRSGWFVVDGEEEVGGAGGDCDLGLKPRALGNVGCIDGMAVGGSGGELDELCPRSVLCGCARVWGTTTRPKEDDGLRKTALVDIVPDFNVR
jgi:hypothetical protein